MRHADAPLITPRSLVRELVGCPVKREMVLFSDLYGFTVVQDIQPNTTTVHNTRTEHIRVTVVPEAETASSAPVAQVTSHAAAAPVPSQPYVQESSHPARAPIKSELPYKAAVKQQSASLPKISGSANSPIHAGPAPAPKPKVQYQPAKQAPPSAPKPPSHAAAQAQAPKPQPASSSSNHASAPITSGDQWCMTYSPYTSTGGCKSASAVSADIASIASKGFSSVRLYSTDCSGLQNVGTAASSHGLKLVLGVFISETGISAAETQIGEITSWAAGNYENAEMVVIGNEAVFNNYCTASALASFIESAKSTLRAAGYSGPVTTTEPLNILQEYAETLCPAMDVASANIHPFFNADVSAPNAGSFVAKELTVLETVCPGKEAYNLETGWPNQGLSNGAACPGVEEQREAIESIKAAAGGKSAFFSFEDDLWKAEGDLGVERSWGCSQLFADQ